MDATIEQEKPTHVKLVEFIIARGWTPCDADGRAIDESDPLPENIGILMSRDSGERREFFGEFFENNEGECIFQIYGDSNMEDAKKIVESLRPLGVRICAITLGLHHRREEVLTHETRHLLFI